MQRLQEALVQKVTGNSNKCDAHWTVAGTTVKTLFHFWFHGDFGSTPTLGPKVGVPPHPHEKMRLYLVLSLKTPKNHQKTSIFEFYCNFKLYICDSKHFVS